MKKYKHSKEKNKTTTKKNNNTLWIKTKDAQLKWLTEDQKNFINSFSRGWFFGPTIMLFYTKQYGRAILCILLVVCWAILWLIPRIIVWNNLRKKAYLNNNYDDFESYKEKVKEMEAICIVFGIIWIVLFVMYFAWL